MIRVLLVDDDKNNLTMLQLFMSRAQDCAITATMDTAAALDLLQQTAFDWLIVDGQMEPLDGFALAAKAKELRPDIRIVMISGVYRPADIVGHPILRIFPKPVDTDALISCLRAA